MPATPIDMAELRDNLGFLLRVAQIEAYARLKAQIDLTQAALAELSVLRLIAVNDGIRQGVLAKLLRFKRAHMTKVIQPMEQAGWITTSVPSDDRRAVELRLTQAGADHLALHWSKLADAEAAVPMGLTADDLCQLKGLLRKFLSISKT